MNWMRNRVKLTKKNQSIYYLEVILNMVQLDNKNLTDLAVFKILKYL